MTTYYRTKGFVFKKEDRLEADRIFSLFTQDFGRIEVVAKAIRRIGSKLRGGIDIFSFSEIEFVQGKHRKTLIDSLLLQKYTTLSCDPEKIEIAGKASRLLDVFIRGQEADENIWNLVLDFFKKLDNQQISNNNQQTIFYYFFWNLISELGHIPELSVCVLCVQRLQSTGLYFSHNEGGVVCKNCHSVTKKGYQITSGAIKVLRIMLAKDWDMFLKLKIQEALRKELKEISVNYYQYLISDYSFNKGI